MKKIMYGMTAVPAAIFILLSFLTYILEVDDIAVTKTAFHVMTDENVTFDEFLSNLNKACNASNTDILIRLYRHNQNAEHESVSANLIYKTNNHVDFLKWHTQTGNCLVPAGTVFTNNPEFTSDYYKSMKLYMPHIIAGDYYIYSLTDMRQEDWSAVTCYTDPQFYNELSDECAKLGIIL